MDGAADMRYRVLEFMEETLIQDQRALAFLNETGLYAPAVVPTLREAGLHHLSALNKIMRKIGAKGFSLDKVLDDL
jgi:hypothetical protein